MLCEEDGTSGMLQRACFTTPGREGFAEVFVQLWALPQERIEVRST